MAVDASGVYVAGFTFGTLPGQTSAGGWDAFVRKYDATGTELWTRQFGTTSLDAANGVAVDASGVYVAGCTDGTLPGQTSTGGRRCVRAQVRRQRHRVWTRQFGTINADRGRARGRGRLGRLRGRDHRHPAGPDRSRGIDAFVRKYDAAGNELWTRQFGIAGFDDGPGGVAVDASGVYVAGLHRRACRARPAGGVDAFVRKYDASGNGALDPPVRHRRHGSGRGVAVDASGVYVAGVTSGTLPGQTSAGGGDAFVRKYDADGNELWTRQFGTDAATIRPPAWPWTPRASTWPGTPAAPCRARPVPGATRCVRAQVRRRRHRLWTRQFGTTSDPTVASRRI